MGIAEDHLEDSPLPSRIANEKADLATLGVTTFGVVIRHERAAGQIDQDAAQSLQDNVVTPPASSHLLSLLIDEVGPDLLEDICDPTTTVGKTVLGATGHSSGKHMPCTTIADLSQCKKNDCYHWGTEAMCNADVGCHWDLAACGCNEKPCKKRHGANTGDCNADPDCVWDPSATPPTCVEETCEQHNDDPANVRCLCAH